MTDENNFDKKENKTRKAIIKRERMKISIDEEEKKTNGKRTNKKKKLKKTEKGKIKEKRKEENK